MFSVGNGGIPVNGAIQPWIVWGHWIGHHVGCRVSNAIELDTRLGLNGRRAHQLIRLKLAERIWLLNALGHVAP